MAKKLRSEQVDLSQYYNKSESAPLIPGANITITESEEGVTISASGGGGGGGSVAWDDVTNKPSVFEPTAHNHSAAEITSGTLDIARIPTGSTSSTVSLGNHTHSGYVPTSRTIAGKALTGDITLAKGDVGLGNVDNTSDANKPISTATQNALDAKVPAYAAESVAPLTSGTLTLKQSTLTVINANLTNAHTFTIALHSPIANVVNENVVIFKIGATLPSITLPAGIVWRVKAPVFAINKGYTISFEQVNIGGWEIWATAAENI